MTLPAALLQSVEQHGCFSGCYSHEWSAGLCLHPTQPLQPALLVSCKDCLMFKLGVLQSVLPSGTTVYALADQLTLHNRKLRGFDLSVSGYHASGAGFWLRAAYYGSCGLFLLDGERSRSLGSDLDLLQMAFRQGVITPPDPRMIDPRLYTTQVVYVNYAGAAVSVKSRQDLLTSTKCRTQPAAGFQRATLAEFQPLAVAVTPAAPKPGAVKAHARPLKPGDICPVCGAEVRTRSLLNGTFVGCLC